MNYKWSLESIYTGFDSHTFREDITQFEKEIENLNVISTTLSDVHTLETFYLTLEKVELLGSRLIGFCNLNFSTDTGNEEALKNKNHLMGLISQTTPANARLTKFLSQLDSLDTMIEHSETLKKYAFILKEAQIKASHMLSEPEEILISKLKLTGSNAWSTLQSKLVSGLMASIELKGTVQELPISSVRNLASSTSKATRKAAYEAELKAYGKIDEAVAMALNSIKGEVIEVSRLRGYNSPLEMTLENSRMTQKTLKAMLDAIEHKLPSFHRYLKTKAGLLGYENGLPFYDLFAPIGNASKQYTFEEGRKFVVDHFRTFSDRLADTAQKAIDLNWIDVEPKKGKVSGAFCASQHSIGEFRILLNYTGNLGDVTTLAHELGHGYHATCISEESILNTHYPMPLAETASTFCETIVNNAALKVASDAEAITVLENSLQDATQVICDIYSRYTFESTLFDTRTDHPLSVQELNKLMTDAQIKAYGEGLDINVLNPYMWLIKPHYYSAGLNFYNFPYAFGLLFAKGLYAKYIENPEFFKSKYDSLLAASGKMSITEVCKIMDIDVESTEFWISSLEILENDIDTFIDLAGKEHTNE
ncbi:M3 family oligoendopeptidase [Fusibacter tunisiensis]|uniref:PepF/M3 family oligoendopeptidase n=1 Tax=Fusibacter tunisiensis TaxID=1008308 RepID=A0ABS2MR49_9FIRM|nr:M3 family oligoendopeptidase [Fusibacter tunisiensis]MBM7561865.1 pepF/M3 family oligoendopeptidase [Fusibacter tunisiensis]